MARPDPALLDPARYPFVNAVTTRFADLDPNGHINNVAMAAVFEDARLRFISNVGFPRNAEDARFMVANVTIDYLAQAYYPEGLECRVGALTGGRSSWSLRQLLLQAERPVATAHVTIVFTDGERPMPIDPALRESLEPWLIR
ncbi:MAG: acyl-CoA thioesterase [Novosphingobium sp.]